MDTMELLSGSFHINNMNFFRCETMNLEQRKAKIEKLNEKYPELEKHMKWFAICRSVPMCGNKRTSDKMDDSFTQLLEYTEIELEKLMS